MRDQDVSDLFVSQSPDQCSYVLLAIGTRINDGYLSLADNVGAGTVKGERRGIACRNAPDLRRNLLQVPYSRSYSYRKGMDIPGSGRLIRSVHRRPLFSMSAEKAFEPIWI